MKKKITKIVILVVAGFLLLAIGYFGGESIGFNKGYDNGYGAGYEDGFDTLEAAIYLDPVDAVGNPVKNLPTANPFEESVNPFE